MWSEEYYNINKHSWYNQVDRLLNTEQYLMKFFQTSERIRNAEDCDKALRNGETHELGFTTVEDAARWLERVRTWEANLRGDMRRHSVAAPGVPFLSVAFSKVRFSLFSVVSGFQFLSLGDGSVTGGFRLVSPRLNLVASGFKHQS